MIHTLYTFIRALLNRLHPSRLALANSHSVRAHSDSVCVCVYRTID